jgi:hypothetical protein
MATAVLSGPFRALASPRFATYWGAQALSMIADRAYLAAFAIQLGVVEHRPGAAGVAFAANAVCFVVPMMVAGAAVDRFGTRVTIMGADLLRFAATLLLASCFTAGTATPAIWIATAALLGFGESLFYPAFGAVVPALVPADRLSSANGLRSTAQMVGSTAGPLLVVSGVATGHVGAIFWAQTATFAVAAVAALAIPRQTARADGAGPGLLREAIEGARWSSGQRYLVGVAVLFLVGNVCIDGPRMIALPLHAAAADGLDIGVAGFAWLAAVGGAGAFFGSLYWGRRERAAGERVLALGGAMLLEGGGWALAGASVPGVAFLAMFVAGFGIVGSAIVVYSALQARVPPARLGRTFAFLETVTYVGGPVSYLAVGALVGVVAPGAILVWSGAAIMLAGFVSLSGVLRELDG